MAVPARVEDTEGPAGPAWWESPNIRSPLRFLWWLVTVQRGRTATGALLGSSWMILLAVPPYLLSRAVDDGLRAGDPAVTAGWAGAVLGVGALGAWLGIMRHRTMTRVRNDAALRTVRAVSRQSVRLGATLPLKVSTGEILAIGLSDVGLIARTLTVTGPGVGAVLAYLVIAAVLLSVSPVLAAVVMLGVTLLVVVLGPLLGRLRGVEARYRERQGVVTARVADLAGGLRVLGGLGGKDAYAERHHRDSRALRDEGYRVAAVTSWVEAVGTGLPALFLAAVTWLGARMAAEGAISVGDLVAVYGYVAVLVVPVAFLVEFGYDISRGLVAAARVVRFLRLEPARVDGEGPWAPAPPEPAVLDDPASGVRIEPGLLTALVSDRPADTAAVVERLGGFTGSDATWGGTRLDAVRLAEVRGRVLVADNEAHLFNETLRDTVVGRTPHDADAVRRALHAAVADDIAAALPDGIDSRVDSGGRNLSGGQRQRVRLARALYADPEVLLAVEPTSALDAHTEALLAERLRAARAGRTTVVTTTSPLVLDLADTVCHLVAGRVVATGTHRSLLRDQPTYRALVARGNDPVDRGPASGEPTRGEHVGSEPVGSDQRDIG